MARKKTYAPSRRVYAAFAIAAAIGVAIFVILWMTSDARLRRSAGEARATGTAPTAAAALDENAVAAALPRGGSLTGTTDAFDLALEHLTAAPLARINRSTDELEPWLAASWSASPDRLIYTLQLRDGVFSAGGTALTAAGVASSLTSLAARGEPIAVRAIDRVTLELQFARPFAPGLRVLDRYPIDGFGPFVREGNTFRRNPHYWRRAADGLPLPYLDEIALSARDAPQHPSPTDMAAGTDFHDTAIGAEHFEGFKKLEESGKARLFELGPGLDADALWFSPSAGSPGRRDKSSASNSDRPWLSSAAFRLAISTAVDRREYCKQVFYGACDPMAGPVSPANVAWFNPDFPLGPGNPELARAMLAELGLRDRTGDGILDDAAIRPVRFTVLIRRDASTSARAGTFLRATLKEIGVQVDVTAVTPGALAASRLKGDYEAIYDRVTVRDTDPAMNLDFWLSSGASHVWNPSRAAPPADWERQIDQLMIRNAGSFDRFERLQAFVDAQRIYLQHMPAIFFGVPHVRVATGMRTLNATPSPLRPHLLWNADNLAALR